MASPLQRFNVSSACGADRLIVVHGLRQRPLAAARGYAEPKIAMILRKNFIFLFVSSFFISFNFIYMLSLNLLISFV